VSSHGVQGGGKYFKDIRAPGASETEKERGERSQKERGGGKWFKVHRREEGPEKEKKSR